MNILNVTDVTVYLTYFRTDISEEVENSLFKTYLDFDTCIHKVCFHCIERASKHHTIPLEEIECPTCKSDILYQQEQDEKIKKYCHCPDEVLKLIEQENRKEREKEVHYNNMSEDQKRMDAYYKTLNVMRIFNGYSGFPIFDDNRDCNNCSKCNKEKYYYIGIQENMERIINNTNGGLKRKREDDDSMIEEEDN